MVTVTVGTNSYITVAECTTILGDFFDVDNWTNASNDTKEKALKMATRNIDSLNLLYEKYDVEQALAFPRNVNLAYLDEVDGEIPDLVKKAQALEALNVLDERASVNSIQQAQANGIQSQSIEGTSVTYSSIAIEKSYNKTDQLTSKIVRRILKPYIQSTFSRR